MEIDIIPDVWIEQYPLRSMAASLRHDLAKELLLTLRGPWDLHVHRVWISKYVSTLFLIGYRMTSIFNGDRPFKDDNFFGDGWHASSVAKRAFDLPREDFINYEVLLRVIIEVIKAAWVGGPSIGLLLQTCHDRTVWSSWLFKSHCPRSDDLYILIMALYVISFTEDSFESFVAVFDEVVRHVRLSGSQSNCLPLSLMFIRPSVLVRRARQLRVQAPGTTVSGVKKSSGKFNSRDFNLYSLRNSGGLRIEWTEDIAMHLVLYDASKILKIYWQSYDFMNNTDTR